MRFPNKKKPLSKLDRAYIAVCRSFASAESFFLIGSFLPNITAAKSKVPTNVMYHSDILLYEDSTGLCFFGLHTRARGEISLSKYASTAGVNFWFFADFVINYFFLIQTVFPEVLAQRRCVGVIPYYYSEAMK